MPIEQLLSAVESARKEKKIKETLHYQEKCLSRQMNAEEIRSCFMNNEIVGILDQGQSKAKLWFAYGNRKDLNIVVQIEDAGTARFITAFYCDKERRMKDGAS